MGSSSDCCSAARAVQHWFRKAHIKSQPCYRLRLLLTHRRNLKRKFLDLENVVRHRPAIEAFSLELPAGLLEPSEDPHAAMLRELVEETGYAAPSELLASRATCSSRISNRTHCFFIRTGERRRDFQEELDVWVSLATAGELRALALSGEFCEQTHIGVLALASFKGLVKF
jgi:ADP-ribose pyrophosphatase